MIDKIYKGCQLRCIKSSQSLPKTVLFSLLTSTTTRIGCFGWSYSTWQGPFYPLNLDNSRWFSYYSHVLILSK